MKHTVHLHSKHFVIPFPVIASQARADTLHFHRHHHPGSKNMRVGPLLQGEPHSELILRRWRAR
jgi:hypothetical protein